MKWYHKILVALLIIIFSPLIIIGVLIAALSALTQLLKNKKLYKVSQYYKDFHVPFLINRIYSPEYRFYNSAIYRKLPINYIVQESNGLEYFILKNEIFLFPDFEQIDFDAEKALWQVYYDGDWVNYEEAYKNLISGLDEVTPKLAIKVLVERKMFPSINLNDVMLPESVFLTWNFENVFENEESPLKMVVPQSSTELYDMMLTTPNLCGKFKIIDDYIHWDLYDKIEVQIGVDPHDCYIGINKTKMKIGIMHWHPSIYEIYEDVCKLGKNGNLLVIRSFLGGASVLYEGCETDCPYSSTKKWIFGKLYYLKAH